MSRSTRDLVDLVVLVGLVAGCAPGDAPSPAPAAPPVRAIAPPVAPSTPRVAGPASGPAQKPATGPIVLDAAACVAGAGGHRWLGLGSQSASVIGKQGADCVYDVTSEIEGGYSVVECHAPASGVITIPNDGNMPGPVPGTCVVEKQGNELKDMSQAPVTDPGTTRAAADRERERANRAREQALTDWARETAQIDLDPLIQRAEFVGVGRVTSWGFVGSYTPDFGMLECFKGARRHDYTGNVYFATVPVGKAIYERLGYPGQDQPFLLFLAAPVGAPPTNSYQLASPTSAVIPYTDAMKRRLAAKLATKSWCSPYRPGDRSRDPQRAP